jgi:MFS transporter, DHA1 family, tetracycline resistance protein
MACVSARQVHDLGQMSDPAPEPGPGGPAPPDLSSGRHRFAFGFVFITVVLDMLAIGIIVPVLPNLVTQMTGGSVEAAAHWIGLFSAAWAAMQFLFMPLLGAFGDAYGRKPVFLFSNFGQAVACALTALAPGFLLLFLARLVSGAVSASVSTAYAYVADIMPPEERAARFGQLGAAFGLGFVLGPALGGQLAKIDLHLPFWAAAAMAFANGVYGLLVLPESLAKDRRSPFRWAKANPVASFGYLATNPRLTGLTVIKALVDLAHTVLPSTFVLYGLYRYGWEADLSGLTLTLVGVMSMIVQGGMTGSIVRRLGERKALLLGIVASCSCFFAYGLAPNGWLFWLVIPFAAFGGITAPALQSLLTRRVPPTEQGRLQGAVGSVQAAMSVLGPPVFTAVFAFFVADGRPDPIPGAALFLAGAISACALALALLFARHDPGSPAKPSGAPVR